MIFAPRCYPQGRSKADWALPSLDEAAGLADGAPRPLVPMAWPVVPLRIAALLTVVLAHGMLRLLPL